MRKLRQSWDKVATFLNVLSDLLFIHTLQHNFHPYIKILHQYYRVVYTGVDLAASAQRPLIYL